MTSEVDYTILVIKGAQAGDIGRRVYFYKSKRLWVDGIAVHRHSVNSGVMVIPLAEILVR